MAKITIDICPESLDSIISDEMRELAEDPAVEQELRDVAKTILGYYSV